MKILVVEDEPLISLALKWELEDNGYDVALAQDADCAIQLLESTDVDLIVTDVNMPGTMDGMELAFSVRDRWPPIKIVVMSGKHMPLPDHLPSQTVFIAKPFAPHQLTDLIAAF